MLEVPECCQTGEWQSVYERQMWVPVFWTTIGYKQPGEHPQSTLPRFSNPGVAEWWTIEVADRQLPKSQCLAYLWKLKNGLRTTPTKYLLEQARSKQYSHRMNLFLPTKSITAVAPVVLAVAHARCSPSIVVIVLSECQLGSKCISLWNSSIRRWFLSTLVEADGW